MGNFQSKAIEKPLERPRKRLKLDLEFKAIEDLPEEIILKIFTQLNIKDLYQCMAVNKKFRDIAYDNSLWDKMHLTGELPPELLPHIIANGCHYLSLQLCTILKGNARFEDNFQLKYLCFNFSKDEENPDVLLDLASSCHAVEKLSIAFESIIKPDTDQLRYSKIIKCIIQSSKTLRVLDIGSCKLRFDSVQLIITLCLELTDLNICGIKVSQKSVDFICSNLTSKIEKLDFSDQSNFGDDQLETLLKRCNKITELSIEFTNVSDESLKLIPDTLSQTLLKLKVCDVDISFSCLKKIASTTSKLRILISNIELSDVEKEEMTRIYNDVSQRVEKLSKEEIEVRNKEAKDLKDHFFANLSIAYPYRCYDYDKCKGGFWEIKAKQRTYKGPNGYSLKPYQHYLSKNGQYKDIRLEYK